MGLEHQEKVRYRWAAVHGRRMYPGALGELIYRELTAYADFGYRFKDDGLIPRLAAAIQDEVQRAEQIEAEERDTFAGQNDRDAPG